MKVAILIPTTTKNTKFKKLDDTHLFKKCLPSLLNTLNPNHKYKLYLAIDDDDKILQKLTSKKKLLNRDTYKRINKNIKLEVEIMSTKGISKGNVVAMWNMMFKKAYDDLNDYFIQQGDDIVYHNQYWLDYCIKYLELNKNIGVSAPIDLNNQRILTQSVVSREHMDIFNNYYPEELKNWYCDDWITQVYSNNFIYKTEQALTNVGGKPRYTPENDKELCDKLVKRDKIKLKSYLNNICNI